MADSSFEIDYYSSSNNFPPPRRYTTTPASSRSFTARRGRRCRTPAIASDDDVSWQSEVSWQFEPTGFSEYSNRNLGSVLTPWAASPAQSDRSRVFHRSANDFYLSGTTTGNFFRGGGRSTVSTNSSFSGNVVKKLAKVHLSII